MSDAKPPCYADLRLFGKSHVSKSMKPKACHAGRHTCARRYNRPLSVERCPSEQKPRKTHSNAPTSASKSQKTMQDKYVPADVESAAQSDWRAKDVYRSTETSDNPK